MNPCRIKVIDKCKVLLENFSLPPLKQKEILVKTLYSAISPGTEIARIKNITNPLTKFPYFPGYSACCRVIDKGSNVETVEIGQIVVCQVPHASHWITDEGNCFLLPEEISEVEASAVRLGTISLQGINKAGIQPGCNAVIFGLGPIGSIANQLARHEGAEFIAGIDRNKWRCELAVKCGIDKAATSIEDADLSKEVDIVIEATGNPDTIPGVLTLVKKMGKVILLGSHRGFTSQVDFYNNIHKKGLTVIGAHDSTRLNTLREDIETIFTLIIQKHINLKELITDVIPYKEAEKVYEYLLNKNGERMITVFKWS